MNDSPVILGNASSSEAFERLTRDMTIQDILDLACSVFKNPVLLYMSDGKSLFSSGLRYAHSRYGLLLPILSNMQDHEASLIKNQIRRHPTGEANVFLDCYSDSSYSSVKEFYLSVDLISQEHFIGYFIILEKEKKITSKDVPLAAALGQILSDRLEDMTVMTRRNNEAHPIQKERVNETDKWFRGMGGDRFQNLYVITAGDTLALSQRHTLIHTIKSNIKHSWIIPDENETCILLNVETQEQFNSIKKILAGLCDHLSISIGLSSRFSSVEQIQEHYIQAQHAIRTGIFLELGHSLFEFEKLYCEIMLYEFLQTSDLQCYRDEGIDRLCAFDEENHTDYFETLQCFLIYGGVPKKVSQKLNIHRNTISYRLSKIEEILGCSIDGNEVRVRLLFACKIKKILDFSLKNGIPAF